MESKVCLTAIKSTAFCFMHALMKCVIRTNVVSKYSKTQKRIVFVAEKWFANKALRCGTRDRMKEVQRCKQSLAGTCAYFFLQQEILYTHI